MKYNKLLLLVLVTFAVSCSNNGSSYKKIRIKGVSGTGTEVKTQGNGDENLPTTTSTEQASDVDIALEQLRENIEACRSLTIATLDQCVEEFLAGAESILFDQYPLCIENHADFNTLNCNLRWKLVIADHEKWIKQNIYGTDSVEFVPVGVDSNEGFKDVRDAKIPEDSFRGARRNNDERDVQITKDDFEQVHPDFQAPVSDTSVVKDEQIELGKTQVLKENVKPLGPGVQATPSDASVGDSQQIELGETQVPRDNVKPLGPGVQATPSDASVGDSQQIELGETQVPRDNVKPLGLGVQAQARPLYVPVAESEDVWLDETHLPQGHFGDVRPKNILRTATAPQDDYRAFKVEATPTAEPQVSFVTGLRIRAEKLRISVEKYNLKVKQVLEKLQDTDQLLHEASP